MAGFCKNCSVNLFGEDYKDFADIISAEQFNDGVKAEVLCEGCGHYIYVDHLGNKLGDVPNN